MKSPNTRVILGLPMLLVFLALWGCRKTEKEQYRGMFGSIVVPNYQSFNEPVAPSASVYLITNMHGEIIHFRRHRPDIGPWEFDELKIGDIDTKKCPSCVIVADKSLGKAEFLKTLRSFRTMTSQDKGWIQVWGAHPYPLQIPIDVSDINALESKFNKCQCLQDIVDLLAQPKHNAPRRSRKVSETDTQAPGTLATDSSASAPASKHRVGEQPITEPTENTSGGKPPVFFQDLVAIRIPKITATDATLSELINFIAHQISDLDPHKPGGISFFTSGFENRNEGHDQPVNPAGGGKKVTYFAEDVRVDKVFTDLARMFQIEFHVTNVGVVVTPTGGRAFPNSKAETGHLYHTYKSHSGDGDKPPN